MNDFDRTTPDENMKQLAGFLEDCDERILVGKILEAASAMEEAGWFDKSLDLKWAALHGSLPIARRRSLAVGLLLCEEKIITSRVYPCSGSIASGVISQWYLSGGGRVWPEFLTQSGFLHEPPPITPLAGMVLSGGALIAAEPEQ